MSSRDQGMQTSGGNNDMGQLEAIANSRVNQKRLQGSIGYKREMGKR